jgi:hypothetical protein
MSVSAARYVSYPVSKKKSSQWLIDDESESLLRRELMAGWNLIISLDADTDLNVPKLKLMSLMKSSDEWLLTLEKYSMFAPTL